MNRLSLSVCCLCGILSWIIHALTFVWAEKSMGVDSAWNMP